MERLVDFLISSGKAFHSFGPVTEKDFSQYAVRANGTFRNSCSLERKFLVFVSDDFLAGLINNQGLSHLGT